MAFKAIDRAKEQASTSGAGNFTLPGVPASAEFQAFVTKLTANGDRTFYCAVAGNQWETGLLTRVSAATFSRTVYDNSSNTAVAIAFTAPPVVFSTVPGAALAPLGGPAFGVYAGTAQASGTNTRFKVALDTIEFDTNGAFDTVLNRFTPKIGGLYQFSGAVIYQATGSPNSYAMLYKNGAEFKRGAQPDAAAICYTVSSLIQLNGSTDFVELWAVSSAARTTFGLQLGTYLNGFMVRALP